MVGFMGPENPSKAERDRLTRLRTGTPTATVDAAPATGTYPIGYDLSSNNTAAQFADALTKDFVIVKASEGVTYKNPLHDDQVAQARDKGKPVAHYHFSRPDSNGPNAEASWFLKCANPQPGDLLVDDFEPPSILPAHPTWVITFNGVVRDATAANGCLYTNQSQGRTLVSLAGTDQRPALFAMPLWKAYYQADIGDLMGWSDWVLWQYTSTPIDSNRFNGDAVKWRALGVPETNMADATLSADTIKAIATAAADEVFKRRFPKPGTADTTSLGDFLTWNFDVNDQVKALPKPTAALDPAVVAKAVNDDAAVRRSVWT